MITEQNLTDVVIEQLFDSAFIPGEHEAYAYIVKDIPRSRLGDLLLSKLDRLDWRTIERVLSNKK